MSILGQAKKLAETENGPIEGWEYGDGYSAETAKNFWKYIKPYFSLTKDCGSHTDCYQSDGIYRLNGNLHDTYNYNTDTRFYKFILSDGSVFWFRTGGSSSSQGRCSLSDGMFINNACSVFFYDINGDKKPNTVGRDIFIFYMSPDGVYPGSSDTCIKNSTGWGCAAYIIKNNNMNYLH